MNATRHMKTMKKTQGLLLLLLFAIPVIGTAVWISTTIVDERPHAVKIYTIDNHATSDYIAKIFNERGLTLLDECEWEESYSSGSYHTISCKSNDNQRTQEYTFLVKRYKKYEKVNIKAESINNDAATYTYDHVQNKYCTIRSGEVLSIGIHTCECRFFDNHEKELIEINVIQEIPYKYSIFEIMFGYMYKLMLSLCLCVLFLRYVDSKVGERRERAKQVQELKQLEQAQELKKLKEWQQPLKPPKQHQQYVEPHQPYYSCQVPLAESCPKEFLDSLNLPFTLPYNETRRKW